MKHVIWYHWYWVVVVLLSCAKQKNEWIKNLQASITSVHDDIMTWKPFLHYWDTPCQPMSDQGAEFWCFLCYQLEQAVAQPVKVSVIWEAMIFMWHQCNVVVNGCVITFLFYSGHVCFIWILVIWANVCFIWILVIWANVCFIWILVIWPNVCFIWILVSYLAQFRQPTQT